MLSDAQLSLADQAIAKVQVATDAARSAINAESSFLSWLTDSQSSRDARLSALAQQDKALDLMRKERAELADVDGLNKLLKYAADVADVHTLIEDAQRMTGAGFKAEVIDPTVKSVGLGLGSAVGLAGRAGGALLAAELLGKYLNPLLAAVAGWIVGGLIIDRVVPGQSPAASRAVLK